LKKTISSKHTNNSKKSIQKESIKNPTNSTSTTTIKTGKLADFFGESETTVKKAVSDPTTPVPEKSLLIEHNPQNHQQQQQQQNVQQQQQTIQQQQKPKIKKENVSNENENHSNSVIETNTTSTTITPATIKKTTKQPPTSVSLKSIKPNSNTSKRLIQSKSDLQLKTKISKEIQVNNNNNNNEDEEEEAGNNHNLSLNNNNFSANKQAGGNPRKWFLRYEKVKEERDSQMTAREAAVRAKKQTLSTSKSNLSSSQSQ